MLDKSETTTQYLEQILDAVHPLMAEGIYLAAVPQWFDVDSLGAMRARDDGRDEGLVERLARYSFVIPLDDAKKEHAAYTVRPDERVFLQRHWIAREPQAYLAAHRRALDYWDANPDANTFVQAQNRLYHLLFVDMDAAIDYLVARFRAYQSERHLVAIDLLLEAAAEARFYLVMLESESLQLFDDLVAHLRARLDQLRGRWQHSLVPLRELLQEPDLAPRLAPYVARAYGYALAQTGQHVQAIEQYKVALARFEAQMETAADTTLLQSERAYTLIALGDAHVDLAVSARGYHETTPSAPGLWQLVRSLFYFFLSLPLVVFLSFYLGRRVWHPRFWGTLRELDWIIARLFARGARYYKTADPILEEHGKAAEGIAADQKLANLYLDIGDVTQAKMLFSWLLREEVAPLGEYRRATVRLGLAEAMLRLGEAQVAHDELQEALPVLKYYEDVALQAEAHVVLAQALAIIGEATTAVTHYSQAIALYRQQGDEIGATEASEQLQELSNHEQLTPAQKEAALETAAQLERRRYRVRYRHLATVFFQRLMIISLTLILFLIPITIIRLETDSVVVPEISFRATPLLRSDIANFTPQLSQGVEAVNLAPPPNPDVLFQLGTLLFAGYLLLSTLFGLLAIVTTWLPEVQEAEEAEEVLVEGQRIAVGRGQARREVALPQVTHFIQSDVRMVWDEMIDNSAFALVTPQQRLMIKGSTAWYDALRRRVKGLLPATAVEIDASYVVLRSKMGILYGLGALALVAMILLGAAAPEWVLVDWPGIHYSLGDLYPYLYLGLFIPPLWVLVLQPLRTRWHVKPRTRWPWSAIGVGTLLAILRIATDFRPWLTIPDIYPSLAALILVAAAAITIWRTHRLRNGRPVYALWIRGVVALVATAVVLVMGAHLWREVRAYHHLVMGHFYRDQALAQVDAAGLVQDSIDAYTRASAIANTSIVGRGSEAELTSNSPGIPPRNQFIWIVAQKNRAAMETQIKDYEEAIDTYEKVLSYRDFLSRRDVARLYASRAIVHQGAGTPEIETIEQIGEGIERQNFHNARTDFDRAIDLAPQNAPYYLWRGVASHALNKGGEALGDYNAALAISERNALTPLERAQALTGKGWIFYSRGTSEENEALYGQALNLFQEAVAANPDSQDAYLGLGYAHYSLRQYDKALQAWNEAAALNPDDPLTYVSLGTLYWRLGTLGNDYSATGRDRCADDALTENEKRQTAAFLEQAIDNFNKAVAIAEQEPQSLAFTYRTRAQVEYLLRHCPGYSVREQFEAAIESYSQARELDRENAGYWQLLGRLRYALWLRLEGEERHELLYLALEDLNGAIERGMADERTLDFRTAVLNSLVPVAMARGEAFLAAEEYKAALAEFTLVAENRLGDGTAAFKAGLAALVLGDEIEARAWYEKGLAVAMERQDGGEILEQAIADLDALPVTIDGEARAELVAALEMFIAQDPQTNFANGLAALEENRAEEAQEFFRQGIHFAAEKKRIAQAATAVLALRSLPTDTMTADILAIFHQDFPKLEVAAGDGTDVEGAFKVAFIAVALDEIPRAAWWYNEAIRRAAVNGNYPPLRASRDDLRMLWATTGSNASDIITHMESQLDQQFERHPDLEANGIYWRFRAWFKYGLGLSAFRLGAEEEAREALLSGQLDADRAFAIGTPGNDYVQSYLAEAAWGWYHVERGDDFYEEGDLEAALADYAAATALIVPVENTDAPSELILATFRAARTALQLGKTERATIWYEEGVALLAKYEGNDSLLEGAIASLEDTIDGDLDPTLVPAAQRILEQLQAAR